MMRNDAMYAMPGVIDWDEALARVVHELRAPLTSILGWATLMQSRPLTVEQMQRAVEVICASARAQKRLLEDLLDHAHLARGRLRIERQRVELGEVVGAAVVAATPLAADAGVALELCRRARAPLDGDPMRLRQVVDNLLSNAIRYSPRDARVLLTVERRRGEALMRVRDSGVGIAPSLLPYVFERFRRGAHSRGLGLGLAIARHIVEEHGGTIAAESDGENRGATFTVSLPCGEALVLAPTAA
jgi:signal transduction histidine kinase